MQQLGRIEVFLEVARQQSFAQAAKALGITGPAASKQVMALEDELGVKLLNRTTRMVSLTDEGAIYFERAKHAVEELRDAAAQIQDRKTVLRGSLKINAPITFAQIHLLPVLAGFAKKYPELTLEITLDDRMVDVQADGYDIVIRVGALSDSTLISKHLADCPMLLCASPEYLAVHGTPQSMSDLKSHRVIAYSYQGATSEWKLADAHGKVSTVRSEGAFRANNAMMIREAALSGIGICFLPAFSVITHIQAGQLVQLLPDHSAVPPRQIVALMPPNRYRSAKVKVFLEWLVLSCRSMPLS